MAHVCQARGPELQTQFLLGSPQGPCYEIHFIFNRDCLNPFFKEAYPMGKGDRRTKRGKIWRGSTGKRRPKKANKAKDDKS
jgi:30S ribosomal protein S31